MRLAFAGGLVVEVTSDDPAVLVWLRELFEPALKEDRTTPPAWHLELRASAAQVAAVVGDRPSDAHFLPAFALQHELVELTGWRSDGALVLDDDERHAAIVLDGRSITVLGDPAPKRWRFTVSLVLYELVSLALRRDWIELHAAAVVHRGRVHLIAGEKGAGKTTLSTALARAGAGLLANDRSFARPGEAFGLPTPVKLLPRTVELLPELAGPQPSRPYLWNRAELASAEPVPSNDDGLILTPAEVVQRLDAPAAAGVHPLGSILLPEVVPDHPGVECSLVAPEEAERLVLANLYRGAVDEGPTTVFEELGGGRPPVRGDLVTGIARRHPVRRVRLGARAVGDPEALLSVLDGLAG